MKPEYSWRADHLERWSRSNHKFMALTPRVTKQSLADLGPHKDRLSTEEALDLVIITMCSVAAVVLLGIGLYSKFGACL